MENKYCYNCGNELSLDSIFCTNCGARQKNINENQENVNHNIINSGYTNNFCSNGSNINEKLNDNVSESSNDVSFLEAFKLFWKKGFNFSGTSSRSEFWYWWLFQGVISIMWIPAFVVDLAPTFGEEEAYVFFWVFVTVLLSFWSIICIVPTLALQVRRLRDMGMNNLFISLLLISYLIPFINFLSSTVVFICSIMPSVKKKTFH